MKFTRTIRTRGFKPSWSAWIVSAAAIIFGLALLIRPAQTTGFILNFIGGVLMFIGAFRIARTVRRLAPHVRLVLGGGYVNTELRTLDDPRVRRFFDVVMYDEGYRPWCDLLGLKADVPAFVRPSYRGIDLSQYINLAETANPMHRLWSDGRWIKLQLARGCYWHK